VSRGLRILSFGARLALAILLLLLALWTFGGIFYLRGYPWGGWPPVAWAGATLGVVVLSRRAAAVWIAVSFVAVLIWLLSTEPSNDRVWREELAVAPTAEIDGDRVTVHNVRNFDFHTEDTFTPRYEDRSYDLAQLDSVDVAFSYWDGNTRIAHTMFSFGFAGRDYLTLSVEVRREKGEGWGGLPGLYRQFEVIYVLGDERDLIRQRTNARGEDLYLYPLRTQPEGRRALFLETLRIVNELAVHPDWYNSLERNCFTSLLSLVRAARPGPVPIPTLDLILNGSVPAVLYQLGRIDTELPFAEAQQAFYMTAPAKEWNDAPDFSQRMRAHRLAASAR
jgi:hypothetical protein